MDNIGSFITAAVDPTSEIVQQAATLALDSFSAEPGFTVNAPSVAPEMHV